MRKNRLENYKKIEKLRDSKLLVYVTGDRQNAETTISSDILVPFLNHLDIIKKSDRISLLLYSNGGNTMAAWSLVNLIRSYCDDLEIIVPLKCQSAATLICLGANRVVMTKQATLGPIDPSTNGPFNPDIIVNGMSNKVPLSVEYVNGYMDMAKNDLGITDQMHLKDIYLKLTDKIHPLALGNIYKSKSQIKMLAEKLLRHHEIDSENIPKVVNFLCSDSGSHDYTINRREAKDELGLNIEKPDDELYDIIKSIYVDIEMELKLRSPFNPNLLISGNDPFMYDNRRALIESVSGGTDVFVSRGILSIKINPQTGQSALNENRIYEGWNHEI